MSRYLCAVSEGAGQGDASIAECTNTLRHVSMRLGV